ncbi:MAG: hypothetical protein LUK37_05965 [Clostridia bacterium]|nr:hypothetical protein [Clostridia bacterium]
MAFTVITILGAGLSWFPAFLITYCTPYIAISHIKDTVTDVGIKCSYGAAQFFGMGSIDITDGRMLIPNQGNEQVIHGLDAFLSLIDIRSAVSQEDAILIMSKLG